MGWICALPTELAAAIEMLDEEHDGLSLDLMNSNPYTFGNIGPHNIVIACLPAGQVGTNPAATVAAQMQSSFPQIRFGLMVGIGGGVPSDESDIRLGDVVISQPYKQYGGVVQYDFGKSETGGQFTRTGALNAPPQVLLTALAKLRANDMRGKVNLLKHLSKISRLPKFIYPSTERDDLYQATYNHVAGSTCDQCNKQQLVQRKIRESTDVVIHCGTIASGNQVIKDGQTRDRLSSELGGVLCFEMEAAGLINTFPCLVIRGICDYADSHKNKRWQWYAAASAAACAKELLDIIPPQGTSATTKEADALRGTPLDLQKLSLSISIPDVPFP